METRAKILLLGLILYIASFFMSAAVARVSPYGAKFVSGAECAYFALSSPLREFNDVAHHRVPQPPPLSGELLLLVSGLVNPVFLISVIALVVNPNSKLSTILRIVLLFMLAVPVYFFCHPDSDLHPRVGYFVWTAAMLLVLFADKLAKLIVSRKTQVVPG